MTLMSSSTLSVSEFAALVQETHAFVPLAPCPRSASPQLRGSPLRRTSGAPSSPRARVHSPSPQLGRSYYSPDDMVVASSSRRSSGSSENSHCSSGCSCEDDYMHMHDGDDEGIIWFGRRSPPCSHRQEQFWHWVEDAEPPTVMSTSKSPSRRAAAAADDDHLGAACLTASRSKHQSSPSSPPTSRMRSPAVWKSLFVLWRGHRHRGPRSTPSRAGSGNSPSTRADKGTPHHHRRMATCP